LSPNRNRRDISALTRKARLPCSNAEALAALEDLAAWPLMVAGYAAIRAAVGLAGEAALSFWDALVVVAAALYTEDLNDGQEILGVRIGNPFAARSGGGSGPWRPASLGM